MDTTNGDFHLSDNSLCIGTGIDSIEIGGTWYFSPLTDLEGNPRPNPPGSMPDIGAYESDFVVGIEDEKLDLPLSFKLNQNYPNPFNPSTNIKYSVPENGFVKLAVYNLIGEEVSLLVNEQVNGGFYEIEFDAAALPSGIYFYRIQAGNYVETKKMILIK